MTSDRSIRGVFAACKRIAEAHGLNVALQTGSKTPSLLLSRGGNNVRLGFSTTTHTEQEIKRMKKEVKKLIETWNLP